MTPEEAIKVLRAVSKYTEPKEAFTMAIEALSRRSIPGLDEAAEEFSKRQGIELMTFAKKYFKAGAEWMAGREKLPKIHGWLSKDPGDYYVHFSIDKPVFDGTYWQSNDCMLTIPEEVVPWVTPDKLAVVELLIRKK